MTISIKYIGIIKTATRFTSGGRNNFSIFLLIGLRHISSHRRYCLRILLMISLLLGKFVLAAPAPPAKYDGSFL